MTEKRYYSNHLGVIFDNARDGINSMTTKEIVDLLNTQQETIQELQKERDYYEKKHWEKHNKWNLTHLNNIQYHQKVKETLQKYYDNLIGRGRVSVEGSASCGKYLMTELKRSNILLIKTIAEDLGVDLE